MTLNVVDPPGGVATANCLMPVALSGLRSDCPGAKVSRSPADVGAAVVAAWGETGGGGGGTDGGGGSTGAMEAVCGV